MTTQADREPWNAPEVDRLRARVAELEAERTETKAREALASRVLEAAVEYDQARTGVDVPKDTVEARRLAFVRVAIASDRLVEAVKQRGKGLD